MSEIYDLDSLTKEVGKKTTDFIVTEYIMLMKAKADILDKVVETLKHKNTSVDDIRHIINDDEKE